MAGEINGTRRYSDWEYQKFREDSTGKPAVAVVNADGSPIGGVSYAIIIDDYTTANVTYIGKALIGTATTSASWQIQKLDETNSLRITWADGNSNFDNVWGASETAGTVAGLSYS